MAETSSPAGSLFISLNGSEFISVDVLVGDRVADLKKRACEMFRVSVMDVKLELLSPDQAFAISDNVDGARNEISGSGRPLSSLRLLAEVGVVPGSYFLASVFRDPLVSAPSGDSSLLRKLSEQLARNETTQQELLSTTLELKQKMNVLEYKATHVLSEASAKKLQSGALFYITDKKESDFMAGTPLFCGFFVSEHIAVTINHDLMFSESPPPSTIYGFNSASPPQPLQFELISTSCDLDFSLLRLKNGGISPAFFNLPSFASVETGLKLGLVTMAVGQSKELDTVPLISQHSVNVTSSSEKHFFYDGASTWKGDSGAALLFEEGEVVGLHLVVDDKPSLLKPSTQFSGGSKRGRQKNGDGGGSGGLEGVAHLSAAISNLGSNAEAFSAELDNVSVAASSQAKVCQALLLSHPDVLNAVHAAIASARALLGGGGGGGASR
jgi:hypothetical protein